MIESQEMIAVLVLAYNSENTIIDTLNSIRNQTYKNIWLIISDDASKDSTCEITEQWLMRHRNSFSMVTFRKNSVNTGTSKHLESNIDKIPSNINWLKTIGADDILFPDCIEKNIQYIKSTGCDSAVFSKVKRFRKENGKMVLLPDDREENAYIKRIGTMSAQRQYRNLLKRDILCSPTAFINLACYRSSGGCDMRIRNIEDWPLKLNITKNGHKIHIMDEYTVYYRMGESVTKSDSEMFRVDFIKQYYQLKKLLCYPYIEKWRLFYYYQEGMTYLRYWLIIKLCKNRKNSISKLLNLLFCLFTPQKWKKGFYKFMK